jgi:hypothetical protein
MKLPDTRVIVFNIAAGMVTVAALVAVVRSLVYTPALAPCTERYPSGTVFGLERGGALLTSVDLQARLSGKDVGLGDNVQIARLKGAPAAVGMGVTLAKGSISPHVQHEAKGGVSFPWQPRAVQGKTSACLAYSVLLPAGFDFHQGGMLPGIRGAEGADQSSNEDFAALLAWRGNGRLGATTFVDTRSGPVEVDPVVFPDGRWVKLEQEVVLNDPKEEDGILRVWIDGRLAIDRSDLSYRTRPEVAITGVGADVHYGRDDPAGGAPKDATIWLTPFEIRWQ